MARRDGAATLVVDVWSKLRSEVLDGRLLPGERLRPAEIAPRFNVSIGVVREALNRLVEQCLAVSDPNRGYQVVSVSAGQLLNLTELRITVEQLALRWSMDRGDLAWESEIVSTHHRLLATRRREPLHPGTTTDDWAHSHRDFHRALVGAAGFDEIIDQCSRLFDSTELYRRYSAPGSDGVRDVDGEHTALMSAVLARDEARALGTLRDHYQLTADIVLATGLLGPVAHADGARHSLAISNKSKET